MVHIVAAESVSMGSRRRLRRRGPAVPARRPPPLPPARARPSARPTRPSTARSIARSLSQFVAAIGSTHGAHPTSRRSRHPGTRPPPRRVRRVPQSGSSGNGVRLRAWSTAGAGSCRCA